MTSCRMSSIRRRLSVNLHHVTARWAVWIILMCCMCLLLYQKSYGRYPPDPQDGISCEALLKGSKSEQSRAIRTLDIFRPKQITAEMYMDLAKDCKTFTSTRGYLPRKVTDEEKNFPIAYGIVIYNDLEMAERLLRAIYRPHNYYCLHLDFKSPHSMRNALRAITDCFDNVFMTSVSFDVIWGRISVLDAELQCMKELMRYKGWRYFINLTGHEFPIKTNLELVKILQIYNGSNDIESDVDGLNRHQDWISYSWSSIHSHSSWRKQPPPNDMRLTKGEAHVIVTRDFVNFVVNDPKAGYFLEWVRDIRVPDEIFFQSLNINQQLGVPGAHNGSLGRQSMARYKQWVYTKRHSTFCGGKIVRNVCNFGIADLPRITHARQLFANKFTLRYEPFTFACMEQWYSSKEVNDVIDIDLDFYRQLPFVTGVKKS